MVVGFFTFWVLIIVGGNVGMTGFTTIVLFSGVKLVGGKVVALPAAPPNLVVATGVLMVKIIAMGKQRRRAQNRETGFGDNIA